MLVASAQHSAGLRQGVRTQRAVAQIRSDEPPAP